MPRINYCTCYTSLCTIGVHWVAREKQINQVMSVCCWCAFAQFSKDMTVWVPNAIVIPTIVRIHEYKIVSAINRICDPTLVYIMLVALDLNDSNSHFVPVEIKLCVCLCIFWYYLLIYYHCVTTFPSLSTHTQSSSWFRLFGFSKSIYKKPTLSRYLNTKQTR